MFLCDCLVADSNIKVHVDGLWIQDFGGFYYVCPNNFLFLVERSHLLEYFMLQEIYRFSSRWNAKGLKRLWILGVTIMCPNSDLFVEERLHLLRSFRLEGVQAFISRWSAKGLKNIFVLSSLVGRIQEHANISFNDPLY